MSAPEPTAVERTIAEVLDDHRRGESNRDCLEGIGWVWACWCECGWHGRDRDHEAHQAEAVVAAIRAMSRTEQAELIEGEVLPCEVNPECGHHRRVVREVQP